MQESVHFVNWQYYIQQILPNRRESLLAAFFKSEFPWVSLIGVHLQDSPVNLFY